LQVLKRKGSVRGLGRYDKAVDMWSIGVIMYILLSGSFPFDENDLLGQVEQHKNFPFHSLLHFYVVQIEKACYNFSGSEWDSISKPAKELITGLLTLDAGKRMTVKEAIKHRWITEEYSTKPSIAPLFGAARPSILAPKSPGSAGKANIKTPNSKALHSPAPAAKTPATATAAQNLKSYFNSPNKVAVAGAAAGSSAGAGTGSNDRTASNDKNKKEASSSKEATSKTGKAVRTVSKAFESPKPPASSNSADASSSSSSSNLARIGSLFWSNADASFMNRTKISPKVSLLALATSSAAVPPLSVPAFSSSSSAAAVSCSLPDAAGASSLPSPSSPACMSPMFPHMHGPTTDSSTIASAPENMDLEYSDCSYLSPPNPKGTHLHKVVHAAKSETAKNTSNHSGVTSTSSAGTSLFTQATGLKSDAGIALDHNGGSSATVSSAPSNANTSTKPPSAQKRQYNKRKNTVTGQLPGLTTGTTSSEANASKKDAAVSALAAAANSIEFVYDDIEEYSNDSFEEMDRPPPAKVKKTEDKHESRSAAAVPTTVSTPVESEGKKVKTGRGGDQAAGNTWGVATAKFPNSSVGPVVAKPSPQTIAADHGTPNDSHAGGTSTKKRPLDHPTTAAADGIAAVHAHSAKKAVPASITSPLNPAKRRPGTRINKSPDVADSVAMPLSTSSGSQTDSSSPGHIRQPRKLRVPVRNVSVLFPPKLEFVAKKKDKEASSGQT
jgi:serine/threonine protein kinase